MPSRYQGRFKLAPDEKHLFRKRTRGGGGCADCGGMYDMLGHVLARREAAGRPLDDPRPKKEKA